MPNSTKRMLAESFKELLVTKPLIKITVQDITKNAQVSRKTFYYYFQDIYDLMEWILWEDTNKLLGNITGDTWQTGILDVLQYFQKNRRLILNAYNAIDRDTMENYLGRIILPLIQSSLREHPEYEQLTQEDEKTILEIYTYGLVGNLLHWVGSGIKGEPEKLARQLYILYGDMLSHAVHRFAQERQDSTAGSGGSSGVPGQLSTD